MPLSGSTMISATGTAAMAAMPSTPERKLPIRWWKRAPNQARATMSPSFANSDGCVWNSQRWAPFMFLPSGESVRASSSTVTP